MADLSGSMVKRKFKKPRWLTEENETVTQNPTENIVGNTTMSNGVTEAMRECSEPVADGRLRTRSHDGHDEAETKEENTDQSHSKKSTKVGKSDKNKGSAASPRKKDRSSLKKRSSTDTPTSSSPHSSDEQFLGFDVSPDKNIQSEKQDQLLKLLGKLGTGQKHDSSPGKLNDEVRATEAEPEGVEKASESNEDMTAREGNVSDSDSEQMEIDMEPSQADSAEFDGVEKKKKDLELEFVDVESMSVAGDISKDDKTDEKTENPLNIPTPTVSQSESSPKEGEPAPVELCGGCDAQVDDAEDGICCDGACQRWFHLRCSGLSAAEYDELSRDEGAKWACSKCNGKPTTPAAAVTKPLLSVRKDLAKVASSTPRRSPKEGRSPRIDISSPTFLKPFDYGWKRELVYRSTNDSKDRRQGDIYYYSPKGKKLRSLREIADHLTGTDLTQDNFTFFKEPLGINDPNKEIIREAKLKLINKDPSASPSVPRKSLTPKVPKTPKTTPKLTATVTPLDTSGASAVPVKASASITPRIVFKGKSAGPKYKVTPSKTISAGPAQKIVITKEKKKKSESDDEMEMGMLPPMWEPMPKAKDNNAGGVKRPLEGAAETPPAKRPRVEPVISQFCVQNTSYTYEALKHAFQYLKVQELLRAGRVCKMWHDLAFHSNLWETVRMKNSQVKDWEGFAATLKRTNTRQLDLRKILVPDKPEAVRAMWTDCVKALGKVTNLSRLELCRCTAAVLEQVAAACPHLDSIMAGAIKSNQLNIINFKTCVNLTELKLKSLGGMEITNVTSLEELPKLKHLSLTTVKNITAVLEVVGKLSQLESLELGEMATANDAAATHAFSQLAKLKRLRLEKGQQDCPTDAILRTISKLPSLVQLELINFDIKTGFEESLPLCSNIKILLIIPTYVTQSATTNHLVIEGVSKLAKTLNHFVWGLTIELLRVTDLFIDQWESQKSGNKGQSPQQPQQKKSTGDSIPILKPMVKDGKEAPKPKEGGAGAVTQVDVLQLPKLHKVLTTFLPNTKIIILKVPFSATWRQTISNTAQ